MRKIAFFPNFQPTVSRTFWSWDIFYRLQWQIELKRIGPSWVHLIFSQICNSGENENEKNLNLEIENQIPKSSWKWFFTCVSSLVGLQMRTFGVNLLAIWKTTLVYPPLFIRRIKSQGSIWQRGFQGGGRGCWGGWCGWRGCGRR